MKTEDKQSASAVLDLSQPHRILVLGNSITYIGHYINYIEENLTKQYPNHSVVFYQHGRSGETVSGLCEATRPLPRPNLFERLEEVLALYDDITDVILCYGMNDGIYEPYSDEYFNAYKNGINRLVQRLKKLDVKIITLTPPPFDAKSYFELAAKKAPSDDSSKYPVPYEGYDDVLKKYSQWILQSNIKEIYHSIDLHTPLKSYIQLKRKENPSYEYGDGIHPGKDGHYIMAYEISKNLFNINMPNVSEIQL